MSVKHLSRLAIGYVLWAVSIIVAAVIGLLVQEILMNALVVMVSRNMGVSSSADFDMALRLRAIEPWSYMVYGIVMIIVVVFLENFFRNGVIKGRLLSRFVLSSGIMVAVLAVSHLIRFITNLSMSGPSWSTLGLGVVELFISVLLIILSRRIAARPVELEKMILEE